MLNNANGASVWTQLVQITALTNWLDSSQQSWGVCQGQGLSAGRRALPAAGAAALGSRHPYRRRLAGKCRRVGCGAREGLLTLYFPPSEDLPGRAVAGIGKQRRAGHWGTGKVILRQKNNLHSWQAQLTGTRICMIYWETRTNEAEAGGQLQETRFYRRRGGSERRWLALVQDLSLGQAIPPQDPLPPRPLPNLPGMFLL